MQLFDGEHFQQLAFRQREEYARAEPFPHAVIDNFLPAEECGKILEEFPTHDQIGWKHIDRDHSKKLATRGHQSFGPSTTGVMLQLNGPGGLQFLETLTGIGGLIPDPYFEGGGLHQIVRGGFLKMHTDFNKHPRLHLDRRINLIVYLNRDWREEYNGHLELWDRNMTHCVRKILPIYNRCVVFSTTDWSYHGHPEKLACPDGMTRKSLALYYYTNGRPEAECSAQHGTMWQERPSQRPKRRMLVKGILNAASVMEGPGKWVRRLAQRVR